jgi:hypothetical protein
MNESKEHFRVTMFFPLRDNDGNAFEEEIWGWLRDELTKTLSGFTDLGVVSGWWQGNPIRTGGSWPLLKAQSK